MEATAVTLSFTSFNTTFLVSKPEVVNKLDRKAWTSVDVKRQEHHTQTTSVVVSALPETTASLAIAAAVVGTAATLLVRRTKASKTNEETQLKEYEDCGGSGICSECKGEGFVLKRLTEENAERVRLNAKNMATRYTAALPKKWSYCTKCSSARSCNTCGGSGKLSY